MLRKSQKSNIGTLKRRGMVQSFDESSGDSMGGANGEYKDVAERWMSILPVDASERLQLQKQGINVTHMIRLRNPDFEVTGQERIQYDGRDFNITSVIDEGEDGAYMKLSATEEL